MRRGLLLCLLLFGSFVAPAFDQANAPKPEDVACTVQGIVLAADSGKPLKSAQVRLAEADVKDKSPHVYKASTDAEGKFSIKGIVPSRYRFFASKNGYVTQQYRPENSVSAALLTLSPAQKLDRVIFNMVTAAVVAGRITDEDGEPLSGVSVFALIKTKVHFGSGLSRQQLVPVKRAVTNDLGEYRLHGLRPAKYYLAANDFGEPEYEDGGGGSSGLAQSVRRYPATFFPGTTLFSSAEQLELKPMDEMRIDLSMQSTKLYEVKGRVLSQGGEPTASAFVVLAQPDSMMGIFSFQNMASVDGEGAFTISGVSPGTYILNASSSEGENQSMAREPVEVIDHDISNVRLVLRRGISISGRVVTENGVPLPGPPRTIVALTSPDNEWMGNGAEQVKRDGTFTVKGLRPDTYFPEVLNLPDGWYVRSIQFGDKDVTDSEVKLQQDSAATSLEVRVASNAARIDGRVQREDKPVPGASVLLIRDNEPDKNSQTVKADQNGSYVVKNLRPGAYHLLAVQKDEADWESDYPEGAEVLRIGEAVRVGPAETKTLLLKIRSNADETGSPAQ